MAKSQKKEILSEIEKIIEQDFEIETRHLKELNKSANRIKKLQRRKSKY